MTLALQHILIQILSSAMESDPCVLLVNSGIFLVHMKLLMV
jgi:hypothetical protein